MARLLQAVLPFSWRALLEPTRTLSSLSRFVPVGHSKVTPPPLAKQTPKDTVPHGSEPPEGPASTFPMMPPITIAKPNMCLKVAKLFQPVIMYYGISEGAQ
jgi:hypothetical protein